MAGPGDERDWLLHGLAGVCLSDQTKPDSGQFPVHRGAHDGVEAFFRQQRDAGGPLGGGGPFGRG